MKLYNFRDLVKNYGVTVTAVSEDRGSYVSGKYIAGDAGQSTVKGALVPMSPSMMYNSGGSYTAGDRMFYTTARIPPDAVYILYRGQKYKIDCREAYDEYSDTAVYRLRWVSAFDTA